MRHSVLAKSLLVGLALALSACGGSSNTKDAKSASSAKADLSAMDELKAIPGDLNADVDDKVTALTQKIVTVSAKVPVLATKVTTEAQVAVKNPFGGADAKAKAQANIDGVKQIQADVQKSVSDAQAKVASVPAMATSALTKLTASFAGKGGKSAK